MSMLVFRKTWYVSKLKQSFSILQRFYVDYKSIKSTVRTVSDKFNYRLKSKTYNAEQILSFIKITTY
jgi:hypothetical protein